MSVIAPAHSAPAAAEQQLTCPMCDYDLRGLPEPRCPECGFRFTWEELRDPRRGVHRYLFEHHPERNVGSFWRTFVGGLRPGKFWRELHPAQPSSPRRLILYWLIYTAICLVPLVVHGHWLWRQYEGDRMAQRKMVASKIPASVLPQLLAVYKSVDGYIDAGFPLLRPLPIWIVVPRQGNFRPATFVTACMVLWPVLTLAGLLIFRASMRNARVRPTHVLRCAAYAGDCVLLMAALVAWSMAISVFDPNRFGYFDPHGPAVLMIFVLPALFTWRLRQAYRHYMRFDQPFATAAVTQFMIFLLAFKIALDWDVIR